MLKINKTAKNQLISILRRQGYATYARLLSLFDVYTTDDPETIAYMIPGKASIVINGGLNTDQVSTIVRHEILHEYLKHGPRKDAYLKANPNKQADHQLFNIAADYEISNRGYTDSDKQTARRIRLNDEVLRGLVTEDDHPDWVNLSFEEMFDKLLNEMEEEKEKLKQKLQKMGDMDSDKMQDLEGQIDKTIDDIDNKRNQQHNAPNKGNKDKEKEDEKSGEKASSEEESDKKDKQLDKAKDALQKIKDELQKDKEALDKLDSDDKFDTPKQQSFREDVMARAEQIKKLLDSNIIKDRLFGDTERVKEKEKAAKAAKEYEKFRSTGLQGFKNSLAKFIKDEVEDLEDETYTKFKTNYFGMGLYMPGEGDVEKEIPSINVYHDVSGSFDNPAKTAAAMQAIESLKKYEKQNLLKVRLYYVTDVVASSREEARRSSISGADGNAIIKHVKATKPMNVIVITDGDANGASIDMRVPGAVWLLFYDQIAYNLVDCLRGKKESKHFLIKYREN